MSIIDRIMAPFRRKAREKEIAEALGVPAHTVHIAVKRLKQDHGLLSQRHNQYVADAESLENQRRTKISELLATQREQEEKHLQFLQGLQKVVGKNKELKEDNAFMKQLLQSEYEFYRDMWMLKDGVGNRENVEVKARLYEEFFRNNLKKILLETGGTPPSQKERTERAQEYGNLLSESHRRYTDEFEKGKKVIVKRPRKRSGRA